MKKQVLVASVSVFGLFAAVTAASAQTITTDSRSVSASVAGALQAPTGFLTGGQVQVTGVGQGAVVLTRGAANIVLEAGSSSSIDGGMPVSESRMMTTFDFSREVETGGALVGVGSVIAQGESLGGVGIVGASDANATRAGTGFDGVGDPNSGSATTPTSAQGSLIGDFTTTNNMQLVGTGALFAGAQTLSIGERTAGISFGSTGLVFADASDVDLDDATVDLVSDTPTVAYGTGGGAGFAQSSTLLGAGGDTIDFNVSNAGSGTVAVSASTGGFFGEGTAFSATAKPTFSEVNGFFNPILIP